MNVSDKRRIDISAVGSLASIASFAFSVSEKAGFAVTSFFAFFSAVSLCVFIYFAVMGIKRSNLQKIVDANPISKNEVQEKLYENSNDDVFKDFLNLQTDLLIDIEDNFQDAHITLTRRVECARQAANKYYYKWVPFKNFSKFEHNIGFLKIQEIRNVGDIEATLDRSYDIGDEVVLELKAKATGLFDGVMDWWVLPKVYEGPESIRIEILLPRNSKIRACYGIIDLDRTFHHNKPIEKPRRTEIRNDRVAMILETRKYELLVEQELSVTWYYEQ